MTTPATAGARPRTLTLAPPHRVDIDVVSLLDAARLALVRDEARARQEAERAMARHDVSGVDDTAAERGSHSGPRPGEVVAFLSVRSGLCALLEAMRVAPVDPWRAGDEVLVSAVTIGDIPRIIEGYGFVPVAIDVDPTTMQPDTEQMRAHLEARDHRHAAPGTSPRTSPGGPRVRAIVVAHLFGSRVDVAPTLAVARAANGVLVIEDCAQAFVGPSWTGHLDSDVAMFSFGTIKTCTALGGALVRVRDGALRERMRVAQAAWPLQRTRAHIAKIAKTAAFLAMQLPIVYGLLAHVATALGSSIGAVVRDATRGFPASSTDELLGLLRRRPCAPLLAFLARRVARFDEVRLFARAQAGERVRALIADAMPGARAQARTHWLVPLCSTRAAAIRSALWRIGVDASSASNVTAVGGVRAAALAASITFVPAYPEMSTARLDSILGAIATVMRDARGVADELRGEPNNDAAGSRGFPGGAFRDPAGSRGMPC